jgi:pimeloyl-ACP methyl ester carboxylesterase
MDYVTNPIDGVRIAYRRTGAGPAIVMVHGTALSQVIWRGFGYLRAFDPDHTVITLDLRGHGRSDKPHDPAAYTMDRFVADVLAVLDVLDVERADYLGYSLGGRIGFSVAEAVPQRIGRFVSAAGAPGNQLGAFDRVFFPGCSQTLVDGGMAGFLDGWQAHSGSPVDAATRAAFAANDPLALAAYMRNAELDAGIGEAALARFSPPTLMLVGAADEERLTVAEHVVAVAPHARLHVIQGAGHGNVLRHPEAIPTIRAFLG